MATSPVHHVGAPTHLGPLSVFPIWTDAPLPSRAIRTSLPRGAVVREVETGPEVERLHLANPTTHGFLLPGGVVFDGGWQHRVLVHGVLVGALTSIDLEVRCVEQARWGGTGRQRLHGRRAPLAVRGALRGIRSRADEDDTTRWADQGDVWRRVERYERSIGPSASSSLVEVADRLDDRARELVDRIEVLPGQRGVMVGIGGHPAVLEVFDHPRTLAHQLPAIVSGLLADALLMPARPTSGRRARTFVARVSGRHLDTWERAGTGLAVQARDELAVIDGVATDTDHLVHLTALNARHHLVGAA